MFNNQTIRSYFKYMLENNITSWDKIHKFIKSGKKLDRFGNINAARGKVMEYLCKYHYDGMLYDEIPDNIKSECGLPKKDQGIDLIIKRDNKYIAIQVKWRKSCKSSSIKKGELLKFYAALESSDIQSGIMFTNVKKGSKRYCYTAHKKPVEWFGFDEINQIDFRTIFCKVTQQKIPEIKLRPYQSECINMLVCDNSPRCKIIMCCGSGKTIVFTEYLKRINVKKALILVPSIHLVNQTYNRLHNHFEHIYTYDDKIEYNEGIMISTYKSSRKFKNTTFDVGIFDEAHRCHKTDINEWGFALSDDNIEIKKRVYFTATERYVKNKSAAKYGDMSDEETYGKLLYKYDMMTACNDGMVVPIELIGFDAEGEIKEYDEIIKQGCVVHGEYRKELVKKYNSKYVAAAEMIIKQINNNECSKVLTFHTTINGIKKFNELFNTICNLRKISINAFMLTEDTTKTDMEKILNNFENSNTAILSSCRKLCEGIDTPCVDGISFVDRHNSSIDIMQRIGRGIRLYKNKKCCKIIIPDNKQGNSVRRIMKTIRKHEFKAFTNSFKRIKTCKRGPMPYDVKRLRKVICPVTLFVNQFMNNISCKVIDKLIKSSPHDCMSINLLREWYKHNKRVPNETDKYIELNVYDVWCNFIYDSQYSIDDKMDKIVDCDELYNYLTALRTDCLRRLNDEIKQTAKYICNYEDGVKFTATINKKTKRDLRKLGIIDKKFIDSNIKIKFTNTYKNIADILRYFDIYYNGYKFKLIRKTVYECRIYVATFIKRRGKYLIYDVSNDFLHPFNDCVRILTDKNDFDYFNYKYNINPKEPHILTPNYHPIIDLSRGNIYSYKFIKHEIDTMCVRIKCRTPLVLDNFINVPIKCVSPREYDVFINTDIKFRYAYEYFDLKLICNNTCKIVFGPRSPVMDRDRFHLPPMTYIGNDKFKSDNIHILKQVYAPQDNIYKVKSCQSYCDSVFKFNTQTNTFEPCRTPVSLCKITFDHINRDIIKFNIYVGDMDISYFVETYSNAVKRGNIIEITVPNVFNYLKPDILQYCELQYGLKQIKLCKRMTNIILKDLKFYGVPKKNNEVSKKNNEVSKKDNKVLFYEITSDFVNLLPDNIKLRKKNVEFKKKYIKIRADTNQLGWFNYRYKINNDNSLTPIWDNPILKLEPYFSHKLPYKCYKKDNNFMLCATKKNININESERFIFDKCIEYGCINKSYKHNNYIIKVLTTSILTETEYNEYKPKFKLIWYKEKIYII